ncbi:hypothetical protein ACN3XK_05160 [Actinomadura welshii]
MSTITLAEAETGCPWRPGRRLRPEPAPLATRSDDEHLAFLLVTTWSLRTGRRLRHAPPEQLTEAELLEFWSDPEYGRSPAAPAPAEPTALPRAQRRDRGRDLRARRGRWDGRTVMMEADPTAEMSPARQVRRPVHVPPSELIEVPRELGPSMHTTLLAVDIESFGAPRRDDLAQLHVRRHMYQLLIESFEMTRLPWWDCHREDRGDGALIVAPPEVPATDFLDPLAHHLTAVLRRYNRLASDAARLRLRLAVHIGLVHRDAHGVAGQALVHLFRLLEAPAFKRVFADGGAELGLLVSDQLYAQACAAGGLIDPSAYESLRVTVKETRARAWFWSGH